MVDSAQILMQVITGRCQNLHPSLMYVGLCSYRLELCVQKF